ncbi:1-phosphofructokinase [Allosalinactinospora lopnorensis]|uniref:1-phosphofructokinase n=1 Tax=Allosalinactinospora lopnorensis TaxID=1352348 RepID=UPI000623D593|nr:1-phosphofructokinase [Allosalinactinospora lopnorensis]
MILTVTPNPSVDHTLEIAALTRGDVLRVQRSGLHAGGKGVNVSRVLRRNGQATRAVLPVGGPEGGRLTALLAEHGVVTVPVPIAAAIRGNVTIAESDGTTTKLNVPGPVLAEDEGAALLAAVAAELALGPRWLVAAGSLPSGLPADFYARLARIAADSGVPMAVDSSGAPLEIAALAGGIDLLKPNHEELAGLIGRDLPTIGDVAEAAREVQRWGNSTILVTLGGHGALLADAEHTWWAGAPPPVPRSTVGAGDCALAGYLSGDAPPAERLRRAVAWGTAAVTLPGTTVPGPDDIDPGAVGVVTDPDPALVVKEL